MKIRTMKRLIAIQSELKAPKGQFNKFGGYKYRSCEDIIEAVKPLLAKHELVLNMSDEIVQIWERYYVKATVKLADTEGKCISTASAYAREEETKKGMDWSQITWSSSSYARKYALNGLFAIDDWVDSDSTNKGEEKKEIPSNAVQKEASKTDKQDDDKPWFNQENLDKFVGIAKQYKNADEALKEIKSYYRISRSMGEEVKKLYDNLQVINS